MEGTKLKKAASRCYVWIQHIVLTKTIGNTLAVKHKNKTFKVIYRKNTITSVL